MRPPKDISQLETCTRWQDDRLYVWCVSCNEWHTVMAHCQATVTYRQAAGPKIEQAQVLSWRCNACHEQVGYLISQMDRARLIERLLIPAEDELPVTPVMVVESQPVVRQMRMKL